MDISTILNFFIFFGAFFSLALSIGQLSLVNKNRDNYIFAGFLFCFGFAQFFAGYNYVTGSDTIFGLTYLLKVIFYFFVGPLTYFYFRNLIQFKKQLSDKVIIHFIPGLLITIINSSFIIYGILNNISIAPRYLDSLNKIQLILFISAMGAATHLAIYLFIILMKLNEFRKKIPGSRKNILNIAIVIAASGFIINFSWIIDKTVSIDFEKYVYIALTILIIAIYILGNRIPNFLFLLKLESIRLGYTKSQITGIDVPAVVNKLINLMNNEKIFRDDKLTLKVLAEKCEISAHQLSQILNERLDKNFYTFINEYRINEAQKIMEKDPKRTILSVALEAGFNSQSTFYSACDKILNVSPGALRKNINTD